MFFFNTNEIKNKINQKFNNRNNYNSCGFENWLAMQSEDASTLIEKGVALNSLGGMKNPLLI
jgi:hypothetical protein